MRKLVVLGLLVVTYCNVNAQSVFRVIRPAAKLFKKPEISLQISRVTIVETSALESAIRAAEYQTRLRHQTELYNQAMLNASHQPISFITQDINQTICKPEKLYGGYNYLRTCSQSMKKYPGWQNINKAGSYNGVHHIIMIGTLNELYPLSIQAYKEGIITNYPFYEEFIKNAPAIFHRLHNDPQTTALFHNKELQLLTYDKYGIKGILDSFFNMVNTINQSNGLEPIEKEIIEGTYLETKLWCDIYGLKWE